MQVRTFERRNNKMAHNSKRPNFASGSLDFLPLPLYSPQNLGAQREHPFPLLLYPFLSLRSFLSSLRSILSSPSQSFVLSSPSDSSDIFDFSSFHRFQVKSRYVNCKISIRFVDFDQLFRFWIYFL
jgi:hypothetical protein